jgi:hypothetical protein
MGVPAQRAGDKVVAVVGPKARRHNRALKLTTGADRWHRTMLLFLLQRRYGSSRRFPLQPSTSGTKSLT